MKLGYSQFFFGREETKAQRGEVTFLRSHSTFQSRIQVPCSNKLREIGTDKLPTPEGEECAPSLHLKDLMGLGWPRISRKVVLEKQHSRYCVCVCVCVCVLVVQSCPTLCNPMERISF